MKRISLFTLVIFISGNFALVSCQGGNKQEEQTTEEDTTAMKEQTPEETQKEMTEAESGETAKKEAKVVDVTGKKPMASITVTTPGNTMSDMRFDADTIKINAGQKIELMLDNLATSAAMIHNFLVVIPEKAQQVANNGIKAGQEKYFVPQESENVLAFSPGLVNPGEQLTFEFTIDNPGQYKFICTYPGHYPQMQGILIVK